MVTNNNTSSSNKKSKMHTYRLYAILFISLNLLAAHLNCTIGEAAYLNAIAFFFLILFLQIVK
jgi:hypothetical protein